MVAELVKVIPLLLSPLPLYKQQGNSVIRAQVLTHFFSGIHCMFSVLFSMDINTHPLES